MAHTATAPSGDSRSGTVKAFGAVAAWYVSTVVLITMNKVLMREHFRLPVFLTFLHMLVSYAWCEFSAELGWGLSLIHI